MTIFKKLSHKFCNIAVLGITILHRTSRVWPDKIYIKLLYRLRTKGKLNLSNPSSFNEKLQWLKLYNRRPEYTIMVDKVKAKEYVASVIGDEYIIPTLGVWEHAEDIDFDSLPNKFVIKCNHNSGLGMYICRDKSKMNVEDVRNGLRKGLNENYFLHAREWPYKNVPRRIIAEQFMEDKEGEDLKDYKLFCFDGEVKFAKVDFDRFKDHHANYYSPSWSLLPFGEADYAPDFNRKIDKPEKWDQMLDFARKLSKDIPFARIDFYEVKGRTYFGEITFFPASGFGKWTTIESDNLIGKYLKLPNGGGYIIDLQAFVVVVSARSSSDLADYKFFCFNGSPLYCQLITDRSNSEKIDWYDMDWNLIEGLQGLTRGIPNSGKVSPKPKNFNKMKEAVYKLSESIDSPFVRIDFYDIKGKPYFGEITFYPASGFGGFRPIEWNQRIGDCLDISKLKAK